jgi:hypothetical protein
LRIGRLVDWALHDAEQTADRWHLMENSSRGFLDAVGKLRRHETNEAIRELYHS